MKEIEYIYKMSPEPKGKRGKKNEPSVGRESGQVAIGK